MSGRDSNRIVASVVLGLPSVVALYGSASALVDIAREERLSDPRVLPFCLDLLAIGVVYAAVICGHDDRLSRWMPIGAYGASAVLQIADVWADGPRAWAVHGLPLAAAGLGTEKILRMWRPGAVPVDVPDLVRPEPVPDLQVEGVNAGSTVPAVRSNVPAETPAPSRPRPAKRVARPTGHRPTSAPRPFDPEGKDEELWERSRKAAADLGRPLETLTRDELLAWLRSKNWGVRATRIDDVLRYAKEHA